MEVWRLSSPPRPSERAEHTWPTPPNLDVSSCGGTKERALKNLKEAVHLFLEEAEKMGTLDQILQEAGYLKRRSKLEGPKFVGTQRVSLPLPLAHA